MKRECKAIMKDKVRLGGKYKPTTPKKRVQSYNQRRTKKKRKMKSHCKWSKLDCGEVTP